MKKLFCLLVVSLVISSILGTTAFAAGFSPYVTSGLHSNKKIQGRSWGQSFGGSTTAYGSSYNWVYDGNGNRTAAYKQYIKNQLEIRYSTGSILWSGVYDTGIVYNQNYWHISVSKYVGRTVLDCRVHGTHWYQPINGAGNWYVSTISPWGQ